MHTNRYPRDKALSVSYHVHTSPEIVLVGERMFERRRNSMALR